MKNTSFAVKASLIASMLISSQAFAQNLPDEINHTHYLRIYQNLEEVLNQKIAEYDKLASEKAEIEKTIAMMEKDLIEIPARNRELKTIIENNQRELSRIDSEIQGLESILGKIIEDLRRIDNMIAQLQRDLSEEEGRTRQIQSRRNQIAQDVAQINARLDREVREENQSVQTLNRLNGEMNASVERENEVQRERSQLIRDVERFRTEIVQVRNNVNQNNSELSRKKPQLEQAKVKLPGLKAELSSEEARLSQIDAQLNPKKTELGKLKAELARVSPDINRLQTENRSLEQKITANEAKIKTLDPKRLIERRDSLENQVSGVKSQIKANTDAKIALQEKIKPVIGQINDLTVKMRDALRRRDTPEVNRLKNEIAALENSIATDRKEIDRLQKEADRLTISIAARQGEINQLNASITSNQNQINTLQNEINNSKNKIDQNNKQIADLSQANAGLGQKIAQLEAEIKTLENQRDPVARKVTQLKREETQLTQEISNLSGQIQRLEAEVKKLNERIAGMQKTIDEYPQTLRRLDAHIRQLNEKVRELRTQVDREQRLLARIRQDRVAIQVERDRAQQVLNQVDQDLDNSRRLAGAIRNKLNEEQENRNALTRYNQDSIRKLDNLKVSRSNTLNEINAASDEISINNQDLATINQQLPELRTSFSAISPKVAAALNAKNTAETNADNANSNYQNRLSLYQKYLTDAQNLGTAKAAIGSQDGAKAGSIEARTKATKLASESASSEGKWEAIRRAYVRGEIAGFKSGFDIGLSSTPDAQRGDEEGRIAGARRAKDHANMVVKPEKYLEELERRLKEDQTSSSKPMIAMMIQDEIKNIKAMSREIESTIPDLSHAELQEASRIVSSLDALIAQADIELSEIRELRKKLSVAGNVYALPGAGENENNANCSGVYKGVKDFVDACKGSYVIRYQNLYKEAHAAAFSKDYSQIFRGQIENVFESELNRLYGTYFTEASNVGKQVGIASGKKEIYQQSFNRAESAAYGGNLPNEISRVETEAVTLVQEHLNQNPALTLKGSAKLVTSNIFGISPGAELDLKMLIKNVGSVASSGNSIVKIINISSNLSPERREAPLGPVAGKSHADLSVMKIKVNDSAVPRSEIVISGEIVHPGNHYRSNRVESFEITTTLGINPSIDSSIDMDLTPKVSGLFGIVKKHDIDLKIRPKYAGVENGYEVILEEVGSDYVNIVSKPGPTEVLNRNQEKKLRFTYKLSKAARGKTVSLKLTVKNEGKIVSSETIQIKPE